MVLKSGNTKEHYVIAARMRVALKPTVLDWLSLSKSKVSAPTIINQLDASEIGRLQALLFSGAISALATAIRDSCPNGSQHSLPRLQEQEGRREVVAKLTRSAAPAPYLAAILSHTQNRVSKGIFCRILGANRSVAPYLWPLNPIVPNYIWRLPTHLTTDLFAPKYAKDTFGNAVLRCDKIAAK